ncbi:DDB1- and CUL4-associated factor 6-like isoform X2 [Gigantopelta aegis]|uniref:DDB1- and CUL4-associated factor 6-like isoform X2 n=1 Tax=Gigantopelta aegis TaxID=1735272 RepID=UPI001B88E137|nr:DDB1- and CUL4-associated factor 6-like isoform X2 [Gigantopelta aegis]
MFSALERRQYGLESRTKLFDIARGSQYFVRRLKLAAKLEVHNGCVNTISWNERGTHILSGSDDQHLVITNPFTQRTVASIRSGHRSNIFSAKFLPNCRDTHIISCSGAGKIFFTDIQREDTYGKNYFNCHVGTTYEVIVVPNEASTFLSCGEDGTVRWFDLRAKTSCTKENCKDEVMISCKQAVTSLAVDPMLPYHLAVACSDSSVRVFDRRMLGTKASGNYSGRGITGMICRFTAPLEHRAYRITSLNYSPTGHDVLVSYSSENIYLFSTQDQRKKHKFLRSLDEEEAGVLEEAATLGDNSSRQPPIKRLRLRGDWSDTGPNARPERERSQAEPERQSPHTTLMQRLSEMLTRWLDGDLRPSEEESAEGQEQPVGGEEGQPVPSVERSASEGNVGSLSTRFDELRHTVATDVSPGTSQVGSAVVDSQEVGSAVIDSQEVGSAVVDSQKVGSAVVDSQKVGSAVVDSQAVSQLPGQHGDKITDKSQSPDSSNTLGDSQVEEKSSSDNSEKDSQRHLEETRSPDVSCIKVETSLAATEVKVCPSVPCSVADSCVDSVDQEATTAVENTGPRLSPTSSVGASTTEGGGLTVLSEAQYVSVGAVENQGGLDSMYMKEGDGSSSLPAGCKPVSVLSRDTKPVSVLSTDTKLVSELTTDIKSDSVFTTDTKPDLVSAIQSEAVTRTSETKLCLFSIRDSSDSKPVLVSPTDSDLLLEPKSGETFTMVPENSKSETVSEITKSDIVSECTKSDIVSESTKSDMVCESTKSDMVSKTKKSDMVLDTAKSDRVLEMKNPVTVPARDLGQSSSSFQPSAIRSPSAAPSLSAPPSSHSYVDQVLEPGTSSVHTRLEPVISLHYSSQGTEASTIRVGFAPFDVQDSSNAISMHNDLRNDSSPDSRNYSTTDSSPELQGEVFDFHLPGDRASRRECNPLFFGKKLEDEPCNKQKRTDKDVQVLSVQEMPESSVTGEKISTVVCEDDDTGKIVLESHDEIKVCKQNMEHSASDDGKQKPETSEDMDYMTYSAERISQPVATTTGAGPSCDGVDVVPSDPGFSQDGAPERRDSVGSHTESEGADERRTMATVAAASTVHPFFADRGNLSDFTTRRRPGQRSSRPHADDDSSDDDGSRSSHRHRPVREDSDVERHIAALRLQTAYRKRQEKKELQEMKDVFQPEMKMKYQGHRNARTMIKEANFWGENFVMSGSDCGHIFIWDRHTTKLAMLLEADRHVVNCLQPHPFDPILASSGIDYDVKIFSLQF